MSRFKKLVLVVSLLAGSAVVAPGMASASAVAYFCNVQLNPVGNQYGSNGYIYGSLTTAPGCGGTFVGVGFVCSSGATVTECTNGSGLKYTAAQLPVIFSAMHDAQLAGQKVGYQLTSPNSIYQTIQFLAPGAPG